MLFVNRRQYYQVSFTNYLDECFVVRFDFVYYAPIDKWDTRFFYK